MSDVTQRSTLYHHLFGMGNILKCFLINHVPAISFASRLAGSFGILVMILGTRAWKNHCRSFSLVSITPQSGREEPRRSGCQDLTQDISPRLVRLTDGSETWRRVGQQLGWTERVKGRGNSYGTCTSSHTHTHTRTGRSQTNQIVTCLYSFVFIEIVMCSALPPGDRHSHCVSSDKTVAVLNVWWSRPLLKPSTQTTVHTHTSHVNDYDNPARIRDRRTKKPRHKHR